MNQTHVVPTATGNYSECEISKRSFVVYRAVCKRAKIRHKGCQGVARYASAQTPLEDGMDLRLALILLPLLIAPAFADMTPATSDAQKQPRTLGQRAVLHIYYYAPKTLEITYVDSYLFKDEDACKNAIGAALQIAMPYAGDGDLVSAKCVGLSPSEAITKPERKRESAESTEL